MTEKQNKINEIKLSIEKFKARISQQRQILTGKNPFNLRETCQEIDSCESEIKVLNKQLGKLLNNAVS